MKSFVLSILLLSTLFAQTFLEVTQELEKSPLYKKAVLESQAKKLQQEVEIFNPNYRVGVGTGYAKADDGTKGAEYAFNAGFNLPLFSTASLFVGLQKWQDLQIKVRVNRLKAKIWRLYGNYCIEMDALQAKGELADIYDRITALIDKGVRLGEFSASDAIMAHLSQDTLNLQLIELDNKVRMLEAKIKAIVPSFDGVFECKRLQPDFTQLFDPSSSALFPLLEIAIQNAKKRGKTASKIRSIGIDMEFSDEIDTKRGMVTFSIPLYLSAADQKKRLALLKERNAFIQELESLKIAYKQDQKALKQRLELYKNSLLQSERSIKLSADTLVEQSRLRFKAGEENLISMLKAIETKVNVIETVLKLKLNRHNSVANFMEKYAIDVGEVIR